MTLILSDEAVQAELRGFRGEYLFIVVLGFSRETEAIYTLN